MLVISLFSETYTVYVFSSLEEDIENIWHTLVNLYEIPILPWSNTYLCQTLFSSFSSDFKLLRYTNVGIDLYLNQIMGRSTVIHKTHTMQTNIAKYLFHQNEKLFFRFIFYCCLFVINSSFLSLIFLNKAFSSLASICMSINICYLHINIYTFSLYLLLFFCFVVERREV